MAVSHLLIPSLWEMFVFTGTVVRGPTTIIGKSPLQLAVQANQKKPSDPGGGTFR